VDGRWKERLVTVTIRRGMEYEAVCNDYMISRLNCVGESKLISGAIQQRSRTSTMSPPPHFFFTSSFIHI
jgi:hypothetical protein